MNATLIVTITLTAVLLLVAWLLGQLPTAAKRMAVAFGVCWLASWLAKNAGGYGIDPLFLWLMCALVGLPLAFWMAQPWAWGIQDWAEEWEDENNETTP